MTCTLDDRNHADCRVVGTVVSTQKNRKLEGAKLLLVQPLTLDGAPRGTALLAIDSVGAGVGERVLVVIEGKAAGDALGRKAAAVDAAIIGIVDAVDYVDDAMNEDALRAMVREAVARQLGSGSGRARERRPDRGAADRASRQPLPLRAADVGGPCLIEPAVPCNHCGYCQSHGH